jgi:peroxiredoxin
MQHGLAGRREVTQHPVAGQGLDPGLKPFEQGRQSIQSGAGHYLYELQAFMNEWLHIVQHNGLLAQFSSKDSLMNPQALIPRHPVPALNVPLIDGQRFVLGAQPGERFDLVVFYRGLHCPICAKYLIELERLGAEFAQRGVNIIAVSSDDQERATAMAEKIGANSVRFAFGLGLKAARQWGLYISASRGKTSIGIDEPALFSEPGVFLVSPDGALYYGAVQTMPFARPQFQDLLGAIDFAIAKDYPARGEYTGEV